MNDYPPDWPCRCGHKADEHAAQVFLKKNRACLVTVDGSTEDVAAFVINKVSYKDDCVEFEPIDNLSYFEYVEKQKADALKGVGMK